MPPSMFGLSAKPLSGRYLSFAEREEIALLRVQGYSMQEVARRLGRAASTISRELRRNAATRSGGLERHLIGRHPQRRLTGFSDQPTKIALRRPLESALLTFFDLPADHWDHLRTSDEIDKSFLLRDLLFWRSTGDRVAKSWARGCQPGRAAITVAPHWRHPCAVYQDHPAAIG